MAATERDIRNAEAWAELLGDVLFQAPPETRESVLQTALANEVRERQDREKHGVLRPIDFAPWTESPGIRHWNSVMRLSALTVQVLVRRITNNSSRHDAARTLFEHQRFGSGSGCLLDYIGDLIPIAEADERAAP